MSLYLFISLAFLLGLTSSSARHVISINSTTIEFSSLAWDPMARHFVAGSTFSPSVYAIPDAGTVKCLLSEVSFDHVSLSVTAVAVDHIRQRLIVTFSNRSSVAGYDLKSYKRIFTMPLPELDGAPGGVEMDLETGDVFVSSANRGVVLKVRPEGNRTSVISEFKISNNNQGLGGLVHTIHGYIITVQPITSKLFKMDTRNGAVKEILASDSRKPLAPTGHIVALRLRSNSSIIVATNEALGLVESVDDSWEQAASTDNVIKLEDGKAVIAVAMREGVTYALIKSQEGYQIEEVFWGGWSWYVRWCLIIFSLCIISGGTIWLSRRNPTPYGTVIHDLGSWDPPPADPKFSSKEIKI